MRAALIPGSYDATAYEELAKDVREGADVRDRAGAFLLIHGAGYASGMVAARLNAHRVPAPRGGKWCGVTVTDVSMRAASRRGYVATPAALARKAAAHGA